MSRWIFTAQLTPIPWICSVCECVTNGAERPQCTCICVFFITPCICALVCKLVKEVTRGQKKNCN